MESPTAKKLLQPTDIPARRKIMTITLKEEMGKYIILALNLSESNFDAFHPHTEEHSDRAKFDGELKRLADAQKLHIRQARHLVKNGVSAWFVEAAFDDAFQLGEELATLLMSTLDLQ
jgi:hypothetical protein